MVRILLTLLTAATLFASLAAVAGADHIIGMPVPTCAAHYEWPRIHIDNVQRSDKEGTTNLEGSEANDELMATTPPTR